MVRAFARFLACILVLGLSLQAAEAARWLRIVEKDPNRGGKFAWFDVDSVVYEPKLKLILAHSAVESVKSVKGGSLANWRMWGVDCKAQKAFRIGESKKGAFLQSANWQTDPKAVVTLAGNTSDKVMTALGAKLCAWSDAWPAGVIP